MPIREGFGNHLPISYSDPTARLAYTLSYAPKHAIIWREYVLRGAPPFSFPLQMNSIGAGCGSEIVGIMEGLRLLFGTGTAEWRFHDTEPGWLPILTRVVQHYQQATGCHLNCDGVSDLAGLWPRSQTVGSMVLSEIRKHPGYRSFRSNVKTAIGPCDGYFLDISLCTLEKGQEFLDKLYGFGYLPLSRAEWRLAQTMNAEIDACSPAWLLERQAKEPGMHVFFPSFK